MTRRILQGSLALGLMLSGCRRSPAFYPSVEGPLSTGEGLRIGMVSSFLPLYGRRSANVGVNAAYLLRDRVNQCGGVNQAPISFVIEQADNLPRSETAAAQELIDEDRVHGAIANLSSADPAQGLSEFVTAQVPVLFSAPPSSAIDETSLESLAQPSQDYLGQLSPSLQDSIQALAQVIWGQGYTQVALIRVDHFSSEQWAETFTAAFEALGGRRIDGDNPVFMPRYAALKPQANSTFKIEPAATLVESDGDRFAESFRFEPAQSAQLATWLDQDETAIVVVLDRFRSLGFLEALVPITADRESISLFWADWLEFEATWDQMRPDLLDSSGSGDRPRLVGVAGITPAIVGDGFPLLKQAWVGHFNEEPPSEAAYAWDAASLFALAAEAAGSNSGSSLAAHLRAIATPPGIAVTDVCEGLKHLREGEDINYEGASGSLNLNAQGTVESRFDLWRITPEGKPKIIDRVTPEPVSTTEP